MSHFEITEADILEGIARDLKVPVEDVPSDLSIEQLAKIFKSTPGSLYVGRCTGTGPQLPYFKIGSRVFCPLVAVIKDKMQRLLSAEAA